MNKTYGKHFINNEWIKGNGKSFVSKNPVNGMQIWEGTAGEQSEINHAFDAATKAFKKFKRLSVNERINYVKKFAQIVSAKKEELARLICIETGKPLWESLTEADAVISKIEISIKAYFQRNSVKEIKTEQAYIRYKPIGVVAVLGPFNFPAHLSNGHIVPALIAGNTIIFKPSELTPKVAEFISECWQKSGLAEGVFNCVQGDAKTAQLLIDQNIRAVYFTGSYNTGVKITRQLADRPHILLALEMGGNNPLILDTVKNIKGALYNTLLSTMITTGQRCSCARKLIVPDNAFADKFIEDFIAICKNIKIGKYDDNPSPFIGPVISNEHALSHLKSQEQLLQSGANPLLKMDLLKENTGFLTPGIIDMSNVTDYNFDEEIFAPLVQIFKYEDFNQALKIANNTQYGLVAGLLSDNEKTYDKFYDEINAGLINWNKPTTGALSTLPFGGIGKSGNYRPSAYFAADYCSYPIANLISHNLELPENLLPGTNSINENL